MGEHARLGCSNSRWRYCPGSVREEAKYPDISSSAAMDGTGSHLLLEMCLKQGVPAHQFDGQTIGVGHEDSPQKMGWFVDVDRARRVQIALDYVERRVAELKEQYPGYVVKVMSERKSMPGVKYDRHDWWGTCDISIFVGNGSDTPFREVVDYKDGKMWVSERDNEQLLDYLLGMMPEQESFYGMTTIIQPKTNIPIRSATVSYDQLKRHGEKMYTAAQATDDPNAPLIPGKHCEPWCKHKQNCDAKSQQRIATGAVMNNDIVKKVETELTTMSGEELARIIDAKDVLLAAISKAEDEAEQRIKAGQLVPGYVIGPGKASFEWVHDEETIAKKLKGMKVKKEEMYPAKLISVAQARKLPNLTEIQRKNLETYIKKVDGKDTLKKGEAVKKDVVDFFSGIQPQPISFL